MVKKTKLKSASRYGSRYSTPLKQIVRDIEIEQKSKQKCPQCGRKSLKRKSYSIWECSKCKTKMVGGAYKPQTAAGQISERIVKKQIKKPVEEIEEEQEEEIEEVQEELLEKEILKQPDEEIDSSKEEQAEEPKEAQLPLQESQEE